jgi:hypothetical protein
MAYRLSYHPDIKEEDIPGIPEPPAGFKPAGGLHGRIKEAENR